MMGGGDLLPFTLGGGALPLACGRGALRGEGRAALPAAHMGMGMAMHMHVSMGGGHRKHHMCTCMCGCASGGVRRPATRLGMRGAGCGRCHGAAWSMSLPGLGDCLAALAGGGDDLLGGGERLPAASTRSARAPLLAPLSAMHSVPVQTASQGQGAKVQAGGSSRYRSSQAGCSRTGAQPPACSDPRAHLHTWSRGSRQMYMKVQHCVACHRYVTCQPVRARARVQRHA